MPELTAFIESEVFAAAGGQLVAPQRPEYGLGDGLGTPNPFGPGSQHSALKERDEKIDLLHYQLRLLKEDLEDAREDALRSHTEGGEGGGGGASAVPEWGAACAAAGEAVGADGEAAEAEGEPLAMQDSERRVLNCLVYKYLRDSKVLEGST